MSPQTSQAVFVISSTLSSCAPSWAAKLVPTTCRTKPCLASIKARVFYREPKRPLSIPIFCASLAGLAAHASGIRRAFSAAFSAFVLRQRRRPRSRISKPANGIAVRAIARIQSIGLVGSPSTCHAAFGTPPFHCPSLQHQHPQSADLPSLTLFIDAVLDVMFQGLGARVPYIGIPGEVA